MMSGTIIRYEYVWLRLQLVEEWGMPSVYGRGEISLPKGTIVFLLLLGLMSGLVSGGRCASGRLHQRVSRLERYRLAGRRQ